MQNITFEQLPHAIGQLQERLERIEGLIVSTSSINQVEQPDVLLTIQETAAFLHLSVPTIYGKVHSRELPFSKQGKRLYFSRSELIAWVKEGRRKTASEIASEAEAYCNGQKKRGLK